ncbi:prolyl oligopeptidase family serine peptidase [Nonomuraea endophytica]|uniref:prolyl oligopeptidase family serine peptidase n=1 Tax=Nonomuraea endophytica TaxID=714136 RepID=UPI0037C51F88
MRLIRALAALSGRPIRLSSVPAPDDDPDSILLEVESGSQVKPGRGAEAHRGIVYATPRRKLRVDILTPRGPGPHPLVLYVPGGGFVSARRAMAGRQRRHVAEAGFVVASIDYRTVGDGATYRDGLADVASALSFLRLNAGRYRIDPARTALWGESAGGYLVAMAAADPDNRVDAVVDLFGASDVAAVADGFDPATAKAFTGPGTALPTYLLGPGRAFADHPAEVAEADPARHVTSRTPPFLLLHGDDDRIVAPAQTAHLHQALRRGGADSTRYVLLGAGHGALSSNARIWTSTQVMGIIVDFLRSRLGRVSGEAPM